MYRILPSPFCDLLRLNELRKKYFCKTNLIYEINQNFFKPTTFHHLTSDKFVLVFNKKYKSDGYWPKMRKKIPNSKLDLNM